MRRIGIMTTTRAEFDLLAPIAKRVLNSPDTELFLIVTGTHLSEAHGNTYLKIEEQGIPISSKIKMETDVQSPLELSLSVADLQKKLSQLFSREKLDLLVLLGDRYELMAAITSAAVFNIPIAHIHGGEVTEGAIDDVVRHAVTKFSHLHFTSTKEYTNRVIQLGESPERVHYVGSLGVENILNINYLNKSQLELELEISLQEKILVITLHPETMKNKKYQIKMVDNLLTVLRNFKDITLIFTGSNSDLYADLIEEKVKRFVKETKNSFFYTSLGQLKYFSLLKLTTAVVGNSSSGIIEVPSFKIGTLNIGNRQKGRIAAESILNSSIQLEELEGKIKILVSGKNINFCKEVNNPYFKPHTSNNIFKLLSSVNLTGVLHKSFHDIKTGSYKK